MCDEGCLSQCGSSQSCVPAPGPPSLPTAATLDLGLVASSLKGSLYWVARQASNLYKLGAERLQATVPVTVVESGVPEISVVTKPEVTKC